MMGAELCHARERVGLSQDELGQPLFVSGSFIGQLEAGTRRMHLEYARQIDDILGTNGFFERNCMALAKSKYPDHFAEAAESEAIAAAIRQYATLPIPGLLQTEAYARAVFRAYRPTTTEDVIDELVAARLERAHLSTIQQSRCCGRFWTRRYCAERWAAQRRWRRPYGTSPR